MKFKVGDRVIVYTGGRLKGRVIELLKSEPDLMWVQIGEHTNNKCSCKESCALIHLVHIKQCRRLVKKKNRNEVIDRIKALEKKLTDELTIADKDFHKIKERLAELETHKARAIEAFDNLFEWIEKLEEWMHKCERSGKNIT